MPYYYALADEFTIGDQYFQSTFTATNPNRLMQFSGTNGLSVNTTTNPKLSGHGVLDDMKGPGIDWKSLGEYLEDANITWKMYHENDDFGCDAFAWFDQYKNLTAGDPLYDKGIAKSQNLTEDFRNDVNNGKLPQVSLIMAPEWLSEHAVHHPADGMKLTSDLLGVLRDNQTVYSKTAFILNYDEGGQFYDHHWTPTPPANET